jgi:hypothetical protein
MNKKLGSEWAARDWIYNPCSEQPIDDPVQVALQPTDRELSLQRQLENSEEKVLRMQQAIDNLYFAAWWSPDRACDAARLWDELRDAAEIDEGAKTYLLGEDHSGDAQTVTDFVNVEYLENQVKTLDEELHAIEDWAHDNFRRSERSINDLVNWQRARLQWEEDMLARHKQLSDFVAAMRDILAKPSV